MTSQQQFANAATATPCTLAGSIPSATPGQVMSFSVVNTANLPALAPFKITVQDSATSNPELMLVTAIVGNTLTVTRGIENSIISAHVATATVQNVWTAGDAANALGGANGVAGVTSPSATAWPLPATRLEVTATAAGSITIDQTQMKPGEIYSLVDHSLNAATENTVLTELNGGQFYNGSIASSVSLVSNGQVINFYTNSTNLQVVS